jgi:hypothetical protein
MISSAIRGAGNLTWKGVSSAGRLTMSHVPIMGAGIGILGSNMTYDPSSGMTRSQHRANETISNIMTDTTVSATMIAGAMSGIKGGGLKGAVLGIGLAATGLEPGAMYRSWQQNRFRRNRDDMYGGATPLQQNERTMAATQQQAQLLGQGGKQHVPSRGFSMMGQEAQMMHN